MFQVELPGNNFEKGKLENLFKADDIEDDSQLNLAYHGELAGKIVEKIFEEVKAFISQFLRLF